MKKKEKEKQEALAYLKKQRLVIESKKELASQAASINKESRRFRKFLDEKGTCEETKKVCLDLLSKIKQYEHKSFDFIGQLFVNTSFEDFFQDQRNSLDAYSKMLRTLYFSYGAMGGKWHELEEGGKK